MNGLEAWQIKIAFMLPKWLVRWATIRAILHATNGKYDKTIVDKITAMEVLKRLDESNAK